MSYRGFLAGLITIIVSAVLCFGALELLLRWHVFDPNHSFIRTPGWSMVVTTDEKLPNVSGGHQLYINNLGIRGDLPSWNSGTNIAVLGGSTVEDWVLSETETWVKQLQAVVQEEFTGSWAANLGKGGVNARHHVIQLPEIEKYMPQFDIIVVLMRLNDFLYDYRIHHSFDTPKNWWREQAFMYRSKDEGSLATLALANRIVTRLKSTDAVTPISDFGAYMEFLLKAHDEVQENQWVDMVPEGYANLTTYKETIQSLKTYAEDYGAQLVLVTQPFVWDENLSEEVYQQIYAGFIGSDITAPTTQWYTPNALRLGLSAYNNVLLSECSKAGLYCVDAAKEMSGNPMFFYDDFHFSEIGARYLGSLVGETVKSILREGKSLK